MLRVGALCCRANARRLLARSPTLVKASARAFASLPDGVSELAMPALSPTMTSGTVTAWLKQEGDELHAGDVLCQVQTDKAVVDYEMQDDLVLAKILCPAGGDAEIPVGTTLALTTEDVDTYTSLKASGALDQVQVGAAAAKEEAPAAAAPAPVQAAPAPAEPEVKARQPLIKFLGKRSLLPAAELEARAAAPVAPAPAAPVATAPAASAPAGEDFVDMALTNMRKIIAKRLTASKADVPHHYASIDCEIDDVLAFRKVLKNKHTVKVSLNDFLMRAVALALRDVPEANCHFDTATQTVKPNASVDISLAVATAAGLITPIVPKVDSLGLAGVNTKLADLIQRARDNKLKPEEFQGGSFTISNLGGFGIDNFTAVINPPQSAILAIGRGRQEIVPDESKEVPTPRKATLLNVSLSADRRVIDDVVAGEFLQAFKTYMENPELLTL